MSAATPREPADARELLEVTELVGVVPLNFSAARISRADLDAGVVPADALEFKPYLNHHELRTRIRMRHVSDDAVLEAEFEARWSMSEPTSLTSAVLVEFVERVALMSVVPYLREAISANAARLRVQVPELGLVRPGDISMNLDKDDWDTLLADAWVDSFENGAHAGSE